MPPSLRQTFSLDSCARVVHFYSAAWPVFSPPLTDDDRVREVAVRPGAEAPTLRIIGIAVERGLALAANGYEVNAGNNVLGEAGREVNPRLERGGGGDQSARDRVVWIRGRGLHPAYPGRQLQNRRPERPAAEPVSGRMVRIVGNRSAALQQLQTIIENRALTCVENVVRLEVVIVSCSVIVRQSVWP